MSKKHCEKCHFFDKYEDAIVGCAAWGTCNRYPPVLYGGDIEAFDIADEIATRWRQPMVIGSDWCGEFRLGEIVGASFPVAIEKSL